MKFKIFLLFATLFVLSANAQLGIKTNILYDATTTPNIGAEVRIGKKNTINLVYGYNPWHFNSESHGKRMLKHWLLMPEYRWWFCSPFNGHFIGVHLLGGQMNARNVSLPFPGVFFGGDNLAKGVKDSRYQGGFAGVGFTYGYQWILAKHWNLEAEVGVGYGHVWYDHYSCEACSTKLGSGGSNYLGLTKLGVSIMYMF